MDEVRVGGPSERVAELAFFVLDHGVGSISGGGPLTPFLVVQSGDDRQLRRFVADTLEAGLAAAQAAAAALDSTVDAYAIAYDGFLTVDGSRFDAIFAEVGARGEGQALVFAQRYRPKGFLRSVKPIGNVAHVGHAACRLPGTI